MHKKGKENSNADALSRSSIDWVFPTSSAEKRTMYQWNGDMIEERHDRRVKACLQEYERSAKWESEEEV